MERKKYRRSKFVEESDLVSPSFGRVRFFFKLRIQRWQNFVSSIGTVPRLSYRERFIYFLFICIQFFLVNVPIIIKPNLIHSRAGELRTQEN